MRLAILPDPPALTAADVVEAAPGDAPADTLETPTPGLRPFHAVLCVEETWTGDGRFWTAGAFTWDEADFPLPIMAQDVTMPEHLESQLVARAERIERIGNEIHAWGSWLNAPEADYFYDRVEQGFLRGVSMDGDDGEYELLIPEEWMGDPMAVDDEAPAEPVEQPTEEVDGEQFVVVTESQPRIRYTHTRLRGATILPFPAFVEAFIENVSEVAMAAAAVRAMATSPGITGWMTCDCEPVTAAAPGTFAPAPIGAAPGTHAVAAPVMPPSAWFVDPQFDRLTPMTLDTSGRISGHLAEWGSCHVGFADRCVTPPQSETAYAHFLTGELLCADGVRVPVGQITMGTGHAPLSAPPRAAVAHYDDTGWAVADVAVGEDAFGIWIAGALRSDVEPARIRALMAADLSGDWRHIGRGLELVAALAVNVPGFHKPRVQVRESEGLVAAMVAYLPVRETRPRPKLDADAHDRIVQRIAASIGRDRQARIAELSARVHGKVA